MSVRNRAMLPAIVVLALVVQMLSGMPGASGALDCGPLWGLAATEAWADDGASPGAELAPASGLQSAPAETRSMQRLYNPYSGEHFYTSDTGEGAGLLALGWVDEGVGWVAPARSSAPVYRLYNPYTGEHHYTMKPAERESMTAAGWAYEGVGWYSDAGKAVPVYREYNPNEPANNHNYTVDEAEHENLVALGWVDEGHAWYGLAQEAPSSGARASEAGLAADSPASFSPVYRLYCPATGDHLYTTSKDERNNLAAWVWHYEGACWRVPSSGDAVYRLFNPNADEHVFTMSASECAALERAGWANEGVAFRSCAASVRSRIPVFRLYDASTGIHHYTESEGERDSLAGSGWQVEGVAWYACALGAGFSDDLATWSPRISGDADFDIQLERILYYNGDLRAAFDYVAGFPYRSGERFYSGPRLLDDAVTKAFAQDMMSNRSGNCYRFASLFCWLARGLGYSANVVSGNVPSLSGGAAPHGWVELYIDGGTYICDPDMQHEVGGGFWYMRTYDDPPTNYGDW